MLILMSGMPGITRMVRIMLLCILTPLPGTRGIAMLPIAGQVRDTAAKDIDRPGKVKARVVPRARAKEKVKEKVRVMVTDMPCMLLYMINGQVHSLLVRSVMFMILAISFHLNILILMPPLWLTHLSVLILIPIWPVQLQGLSQLPLHSSGYQQQLQWMQTDLQPPQQQLLLHPQPLHGGQIHTSHSTVWIVWCVCRSLAWKVSDLSTTAASGCVSILVAISLLCFLTGLTSRMECNHPSCRSLE